MKSRFLVLHRKIWLQRIWVWPNSTFFNTSMECWFSHIHNNSHWLNIGTSTKRNFWNLVEIYLDSFSSNTFWKFTIHISNKILKLRSFTLLPNSSNSFGAGRHSSDDLTYAASSQFSILTLLEQFFKDCLTFCIANYLFNYLFIWAVKNLFLTGHSFFIGKIIIEEKRG